jgi:hypothetical protein
VVVFNRGGGGRESIWTTFAPIGLKLAKAECEDKDYNRRGQRQRYNFYVRKCVHGPRYPLTELSLIRSEL